MKKIKNFLIIILFLYIILQIFIYKNDVYNVIIFSYDIFINNVFPNLFPLLVLSNILINYGFVDICYKVFNPIMNRLFGISGTAAFVFIMSILTGFPSNAKYTKELYDLGKLNDLEATKLLMFTHFSNPLFVIGIISTFINLKVAIIILICHYLGNVIIGILTKKLYISNNNNKISKTKEESFSLCFSKSIINSINTLLLIYGTITSFLIFTVIIKNTLNLNTCNQAILSGILEITQGLKYVSLLGINIKCKAILMGMFISFGGVSVHMQILSIISDSKIKYYPFLVARFLHALITGFLIFLII